MSAYTVSPDIRLIGLGLSRPPVGLPIDVRMAVKIDKHTSETAGVEIHLDAVSMRILLDGRPIGQQVNSGNAVDFISRFSPLRRRVRRRDATCEDYSDEPWY